ncbi:hypothetical protein [Sphaerisporangium krabiense]|uniref:Uncharacterized protein n=1 Tax=Sphaerisporangium krabiense TaxID=763782 RepID=A0A7W8ZCX3_9ACTN|nr:hypothetical protein [Sphaerisporangium krabiense]MBB5631378.1 hypothetical protein [Sphaerisporangium krabiense]
MTTPATAPTPGPTGATPRRAGGRTEAISGTEAAIGSLSGAGARSVSGVVAEGMPEAVTAIGTAIGTARRRPQVRGWAA